MWEGTLADLAQETSARPLDAFDADSTPARSTFRFTVEVSDDASAMGRWAGADIIWESAPR